VNPINLTLVIATLRRGGGERLASILAGAWAEHGKRVTLITCDQGEAPSYSLHSDVKLINLGLLSDSHNPATALWKNAARIFALRRAIRATHPHAVISFMDSTNVLVILAMRLTGIPVFVCEQMDPELFKIKSAWHTLRNLVYPFADALVCPVKGSLEKFQAMSRVRGYVIPNPIDVPAPIPRASQRSVGHVLAAMGRLVPAKGFDLLLAAFSQIAGRHPDWTLVIYGGGPLLEPLQLQAESLGLVNRVHFAGSVADPFPMLRAADLFAFSSRTEGFGMALAEAMACGLPAVSFNCPEGPANIIRDGLDGILVPPEDVNALASALDRLMGDPQERERLAARAPEVRERFSIERVLTLWQQMFDSVH
jgi:glycosyltransferase involved in cell wall biosynthesis